MPNTLAHLGVQALATRAVIQAPDPKWIYLGCVIPDAPWIAHRVLRMTLEGADPYDLRMYAIAQSSLALSLLLCGVLAPFSSAPRRCFAILSINAVLHLLIDGLQTKWGNGVHLLAPFSWDLWNAGLFWPESPVTLLLVAVGLSYFGWAAWRGIGTPIGLRWPAPGRLALAADGLAVYVALPLGLLEAVEASDSHFLRTLRERADRAGRPVEVDRGIYLERGGDTVLQLFSREEVRVVGAAPLPAPKLFVSVRGRFLDPDTIAVEAEHVHRVRWRDRASYVGLLAVAAAWLLDAARARWRRRRPASS